MAVAMFMKFPGCTREQYESVINELKLNDPNNVPSGLLHHVAGPLENGWSVIDVWESQKEFDVFFQSKLRQAMQNAKIQPPQPITFQVHNTMGRHAPARTRA
jgi:hypothetical protein